MLLTRVLGTYSVLSVRVEIRRVPHVFKQLRVCGVHLGSYMNGGSSLYNVHIIG